MKILIANDKGGVGKSTLAQVIALRQKFARRSFSVIELDGRSKLCHYFGPDVLTSLSPWGEDAEEVLDRLIDALAAGGDVVVDFGAQTFSLFCDWARQSGLSDIVDPTDFVLVLPFTADQEAVSAAVDVINQAISVFGSIRLVPVAVQKDGDVRLLEGVPIYDQLRRILNDCTPLSVAALPNDAYPALAARRWGFERIVGASSNEIAAASGLSLARANRTIRSVRAWLEGLMVSLAALDGDTNTAPVPGPGIPTYPTTRPTDTRPPLPIPAPETAAPLTSPGPVEDFDEDFYMANNPDVAAAVRRGEFRSGFEHYRLWGRQEDRPGAQRSVAETEQSLFNENFYLAANPDVAAAVQRGVHASGYDHYKLVGRQEGRRARFRQLG